MATVIDALVVTLGLDASKFTQGSKKTQGDLKKTREDASKTAKHMEEAGKHAAVFFSKLRNEALMFAGVLLGAHGIKSFAANAIASATNLGRMSENLDMGVKRLQAWELAARNAGGTAEGIAAQLKESQAAVAAGRRGISAPGVQEFYAYGGADIRTFKSGEGYLKARIALVQRQRELFGIGQARFAASQMGLDDSQFNFYRLGSAEVEKSLSAFEKLSRFTKEDAKNAVALTQKWDILGDRFQLVGVRIGAVLMPYLEKFEDWLGRLADWIDAHQDLIKSWVEKAIGVVKEFDKDANDAAQAVGGWKNVLIALAGLKILSMISSFFALGRALKAIGSALGLIGRTGGAAASGLGVAGAVVASGAVAALYSSDLNKGEQAQLNALRSRPKNLDRQNDAVAYFVSKGWAPVAAAGIVANLQSESRLNPGAVGDNGAAFGIAQWHQDRQDQFKEIYGFDIRKATLTQQLAYLDWELRHSEKKAGDLLKNATTPQQAGAIVSRYYERPQDADGQAKERANLAGAVYGQYALKQGTSPTASGSQIPLKAQGQVLPVNAVNTLNAASTRYRSAPITNNTTSSSSVALNGPVTIQTQATDAKGLLHGLNDYIKGNILANDVNTGLQ